MAAPTGAPAPTDALKFCWPWRPYQARVLGAIEHHLSDRKLHIVAVPGSGKTTLGLNKERAQALLRFWTRRVGPSQLIYTRTAEGRGLLLEARGRSFATAVARDEYERQDRWV